MSRAKHIRVTAEAESTVGGREEPQGSATRHGFLQAISPDRGTEPDEGFRDFEFPISPSGVCRALFIAMLWLTIMGIAVQVLNFELGYDYQMGLRGLFDLSADSSIPTWFASATLLLCSLLLASITIAKRRDGDRYRHHWGVLSVIFLLLSIDEVARIHETVGARIGREVIGPMDGFLYYAWVIPGSVFVLAVVLAYGRLVLSLPARTKLVFISAGLVFVAGAIGVEMVNARHDAMTDAADLTYHMMTAFEEFLEMSGIVIFIYALMSYLATQLSAIHIRVASDGRDSL